MAVCVNEIKVLKELFLKVVDRTNSHAPNVNEIVYPLLSCVILIMDEKSDIQVRSADADNGNMLWFTTNGKRYASRYEDDLKSIVIRKGSFEGDLVTKVNNSTSTTELKQIFADL